MRKPIGYSPRVHGADTLIGRARKDNLHVFVSTPSRFSVGRPLKSLTKYIELQNVESDDAYFRIDNAW